MRVRVREQPPLASFPHLYGMENIYVYGDLYLRKPLKTVNNQFWKDSIRSLLILIEQQPYNGIEALLTKPLWYNLKNDSR